MSTIETSPAAKVPQPSTRHIRTDARFAAVLASDFPALPAGVILDALVGEPQKQAIALCAWASSQDDPARALGCWAQKHRKGHHRRCRETSAPCRGTGTPARRDAVPDGLRGIRCDPDALDRLAARLGV